MQTSLERQRPYTHMCPCVLLKSGFFFMLCIQKSDPWACVGSNIELGEGDFFPQRRRFGNSFVA